MKAARALLAVAALGAACSLAPKPAHGPVDYAAPGGRFSARLPAAWRVDESPGVARLASFFGPGTGADAEMIEVYYYPASSPWKSARDFAFAQTTTGRAGPVVEARVAGVPALDVVVEREIGDERLGRREQRVRTLAVPAADGFYALKDYVDPARAAGGADFAAFAASFRPGPPSK